MDESIVSLKKKARLAGVFYFLTAVTTIFGLLYVRGELIVFKNATATADNIISNEFLFRAGIAVNLFCQVLQLFLAFALYELFKNVGKTVSAVMLASKLISLTLATAGLLGNYAALQLLSGQNHLQSFSREQLNGLTIFFLRLTNEMQGLLEVFWLPANFCIGWLIIRSGFIPKILGYLMILGGFGFALNVYIKLLIPDWQAETVTLLTMFLGSSGGIPIIFYLLIWGANRQSQD